MTWRAARCAAVVAAAALAIGGCGRGRFLGAAMPGSCGVSRSPDLTTEACAGWVLDHFLMASLDDDYAAPALHAYVTAIAARLARASRLRRPTIRILDASSSLARAGPGGYVYLSRTLFAVLDSEAELAAVIAHELAHGVAGHTAKLLASEPLPADAALGDQMSRDDEATADELAVAYLAAAGYAPDAMRAALVALDRASTLAGREAVRSAAASRAPPGVGDAAGRDPIADVVSGAAPYVAPGQVVDVRRAYPRPIDPDDPVHPALVERIARVARLAAGRDGDRGVERFRAHVAGVIVGDDPRRTRLDGATWSSARLGLAADLPTAWEPEDNGRRLDVFAARHSATLWPVGKAWAKLAVSTLAHRRRVRIAGWPAVVGIQPVEGDPAGERPPPLPASADRPSPAVGSAVAVITVGERALMIYVHGAAAHAQLGAVLRRVRRATPEEIAAAAPARLVWTRAPRAGVLGELIEDLCKIPEHARWLDDPTRTVRAGEAIKCVERAPRPAAR